MVPCCTSPISPSGSSIVRRPSRVALSGARSGTSVRCAMSRRSVGAVVWVIVIVFTPLQIIFQCIVCPMEILKALFRRRIVRVFIWMGVPCCCRSG